MGSELKPGKQILGVFGVTRSLAERVLKVSLSKATALSSWSGNWAWCPPYRVLMDRK